jgi:hypothetical protein
MVGAVVFLVLCAGCSGARYRALDLEAGLARAKAEKDYVNLSARGNTLASFDVLTLASLVPDPWSGVEAVMNIEARASGSPGALAGAVSLATWEGTRVYLGDTHERAYASFLGGVMYWMLGQDDNAAALWRNSLDIDRESVDGFREDFALTQYLLAKYNWNKPGQRDNAEIYLNQARRSWPGNPYLRPERVERDNVVVLVEVGTGPRKATTGPQGSMLVWERGPYRGGPVTVDVNGSSPMLSSQILDLFEQSRYALRVMGKDVLQAVKGTAAAVGVGYAVYRFTDSPLLAILAALLLKTMPADMRQWWGLPAQVQLVSTHLPPGKYTLGVRTGHSGGDQLAGQYVRVRDVEVLADDWSLVLIRPVRMLSERRALPPPGLPSKGILGSKNAPPAPGSPILDLETVESELARRSPLYKYLPTRKELEASDGGRGADSAAPAADAAAAP